MSVPSFSLSLHPFENCTTQNGPLFHSTSLSDFLLLFRFLSLFVRKLHTGLLFCQFISTHGLSTPLLFLSLSLSLSLTFSLVHELQHPPLHSLFLDGFFSFTRSAAALIVLSRSPSVSLLLARALYHSSVPFVSMQPPSVRDDGSAGHGEPERRARTAMFILGFSGVSLSRTTRSYRCTLQY